MKVFAIALLSYKILSYLSKIIVFAVSHIFENFGMIFFQNFLLSITFLTSMLLKYCVLLLRKKLIQIFCLFM